MNVVSSNENLPILGSSTAAFINELIQIVKISTRFTQAVFGSVFAWLHGYSFCFLAMVFTIAATHFTNAGIMEMSFGYLWLTLRKYLAHSFSRQ